MVPAQTHTTSRRKYKHHSAIARGPIRALLDQGLTYRAIARELGRRPSTIARQIKRGTTTQMDTNLVAHQRFYPETGQAVYEKNWAICKRQLRIGLVTKFLNWSENKMRDESWAPYVVVSMHNCIARSKEKRWRAPRLSTVTLTATYSRSETLICR